MKSNSGSPLQAREQVGRVEQSPEAKQRTFSRQKTPQTPVKPQKSRRERLVTSPTSFVTALGSWV
ncbi:unnamed protein product [Gulo gulo]|uniref:Uncharacterized protein n=1 Tax=Gulo gulo TaxID=48420 RepID=A0A9X9MAP8_GULGU|nr:unnamed protein product [Gulo gulo]